MKLCTGLAVLLFFSTTAAVASANRVESPVVDQHAPAAADVADLQEQLEDGLHARLPAEFAFIARVVALVQSNRLPLSTVQGTFRWAQRKKPFPFPFFERAMRLRAAQLGVRL